MKIRIPVRTHLPVENLRFFLALLCISSYALLEHVSISIPAFSPIKFILLYIAGICIVFEISLIFRNIQKRKYFFAAALLMMVVATLLLSAYMNRKPVIGSSPVYGTVRLILYLIELFALVIWSAQTGRAQYVTRFLFRYLLILVAITDLLLLTGWIQFSAENHMTFLLGTKFSVAYRHIELLALWLMCDRERFQYLRRKKGLMIPMTILLVMLFYMIDCMTGIVGIIGYFWAYSFADGGKRNRFQLLSNPMVFAFALLCSVSIAFVIDFVVSNPIVEFILQDLLQRDTTLTGRVHIFNMFGRKMSDYWLFGFGFGNGNAAAKWLFRYANAQNALLHWILQTGIFVTMSLCFWLCRIFSQLYSSRTYGRTAPIVVLVYVFVVLGTIETTFNMAFILWCALILMYTCEVKTS